MSREAAPGRGQAPLPGGAETLLVVDDESSIRDLTREVLTTLGYRVLAAANGTEATDLVTRHPVDLVLSDLQLPHERGCDLVRRLQVLRPGVRALFVSGMSGDLLRNQGLLDPGAEFLAKPFTIAALATRVRALLDRPR